MQSRCCLILSIEGPVVFLNVLGHVMFCFSTTLPLILWISKWGLLCLISLRRQCKGEDFIFSRGNKRKDVLLEVDTQEVVSYVGWHVHSTVYNLNCKNFHGKQIFEGQRRFSWMDKSLPLHGFEHLNMPRRYELELIWIKSLDTN